MKRLVPLLIISAFMLSSCSNDKNEHQTTQTNPDAWGVITTSKYRQSETKTANQEDMESVEKDTSLSNKSIETEAALKNATSTDVHTALMTERETETISDTKTDSVTDTQTQYNDTAETKVNESKDEKRSISESSANTRDKKNETLGTNEVQDIEEGGEF